VRRSDQVLLPDRTPIRDQRAVVLVSKPIGRCRLGRSPSDRADLHDQRNPLAVTPADITSRPLMTVNIVADRQQKFGAVPYGVRSFVPVTGGDFEGPRLRGKVLSGGGDWLLL